jgi:hypothetical protein
VDLIHVDYGPRGQLSAMWIKSMQLTIGHLDFDPRGHSRQRGP